MTAHEVTGVEYVPVCDQCWESVSLTEADDGTWEHAHPRSSLEVERDRATDAWADRDALVAAIDQMCDEAERVADTVNTHVTVSVLRTMLDPYRTRL